MHLHILGLSGTFMSALALLAREAGHQVTGSDEACYPPVSDLLKEKGISWTEGYQDATQALKADCVIVGNAIKRGMPVIEAVLDYRKPYVSGPQWLAENILTRYKVLAVAGTHGKTTTTSMLSFILEKAGLNPGFLIGGVASDFKTSSRLGTGDWFVIEADEYDSAFFDKRPKFMHYRPDIAILNNLEFDHADIYSNLAAIQKQFHFFMKTIPGNGLVIKPSNDVALNEVLSHGQFSRVEQFSLTEDATWCAELLAESGEQFQVLHHQKIVAEVHWNLLGKFNVENALAAIAAAYAAGVSPKTAADALSHFTPVKRRLEVKASTRGITVYDDFAHHPTAIAKTIQALKSSHRHTRILAVLEFASYTMRSGIHANEMKNALAEVDMVFVLNPTDFNVAELAKNWLCPYQILPDTAAIVHSIVGVLQKGDAVLIMSNKGFNNIHHQIISVIEQHLTLV